MSPQNSLMKNVLILFGLLILASPKSNAQFGEDPILNLQNEDKRFLNWGYYLGFNQYDFQFEYKDDVGRDVLVDKSFGFNVGLIGELRINEFLDARFEPGLLYTARTLGFPFMETEADAIREVRSTYIRFPLLLKASTKRIGNWKPFIVGEKAAHDTSERVGDKRAGTFNNFHIAVSHVHRMRKQFYKTRVHTRQNRHLFIREFRCLVFFIIFVFSELLIKLHDIV